MKQDIKVAQLSGYVAEHSAYHHGEVSLAMTVVQLAQNFVGSNNINLLLPIGQFGSRVQGGKEAASARYIFTNLNKVTRHLFHEHDDLVLGQLEEEG
jgi:DNA topoisomerase-2